MPISARRAFWPIALLGAIACSSNDKGLRTAAQGEERGPCYPNHTCNAGLTCLSDICVDASRDAGSTDGGGGSSGAGGRPEAGAGGSELDGSPGGAGGRPVPSDAGAGGSRGGGAGGGATPDGGDASASGGVGGTASGGSGGSIDAGSGGSGGSIDAGPVNLGVGCSLVGHRLNTVVAAAPNDVWAAGQGVFHFDGTNWTESLGGSTIEYFGAWIASPKSVWVVGNDQGIQGVAVVVHWDGTNWLQLPPSGVGGTQYMWQGAVAVWGTSDTNVWVGGGSGAANWNGSSWLVSAPNGPGNGTVRGLHGTATDDVWAVGEDTSLVFPIQPPPKPTIWHFDGVKWSRVRTPGQVPYSVYATSAGNVWFSGGVHWNGHVFDQTGPVGESIWASSATDAWALHTDGFSFHGATRWRGSAWEDVTGIPSGHYYSVGGTSPSDVWLVGEQGVAAHFDGSSWSAVVCEDGGVAPDAPGPTSGVPPLPPCSSDCSTLTVGCSVGACNTSTGLCEITSLEDGAACSVGNVCIDDASCSSGHCVGGLRHASLSCAFPPTSIAARGSGAAGIPYVCPDDRVLSGWKGTVAEDSAYTGIYRLTSLGAQCSALTVQWNAATSTYSAVAADSDYGMPLLPGTASGASFDRVCPNGEVVVGVSGSLTWGLRTGFVVSCAPLAIDYGSGWTVTVGAKHDLPDAVSIPPSYGTVEAYGNQCPAGQVADTQMTMDSPSVTPITVACVAPQPK